MLLIRLFLLWSCILSVAHGINWIKLIENLSMHIKKDATLIVNSKETSTIMSNSMIKTLTNQYPLTVIDIDGSQQRIKCITNICKNELFLIILNQDVSANITQQFKNHLDFLTSHLIGKLRPKCLIITFNVRTNSKYFSDFLKYAWDHNFLDIDIFDYHTQTRHTYNPFNKVFESLHSYDFFPDKLVDFYQYKLSTILYDYLFFVEVDERSSGRDLWDMVQGMDVQVSKILQRFFNFSVNIVDFVTSNEKLKSLLKDNLSANQNSRIDFQVNLFCPLQVAWLMHVDPSKFEQLAETLIYPSSQHLMVKQYGTQSTSLSFNFTTLFNMAAIVLIIKILVRLFRFDPKTWSSYYVIKIILGCSEMLRSHKVDQRLFFLVLTFVNVAFLGDIMWGFLHSFLTEKKYFDFQSLLQVLDQGVTPHIANQTKQELVNTDLHELVLKSATIKNYEEITGCLKRLLGGEYQGCEVLDSLGHILANDFEEPSNEWTLTLVEEPLLSGWTTMLHYKHSAYMKKFDLVLRRLFEGGIIGYWRDFYLRRFVRIYNVSEFTSWSSRRSVSDYLRNAGSSPYSVLRTYGIGLVICIVVFIMEIVVDKLNLNIFGRNRLGNGDAVGVTEIHFTG